MRPRYYCDFCDKRGGSAWHILRHESACTKNPQRECRMCRVLFAQEQPSIEILKAILPNPDDFRHVENWGTVFVGIEKPLEAIFPVLREAAGNCPACIMAALRQKGIPVPCSPLRFTDECREAWNDFNANQNPY